MKNFFSIIIPAYNEEAYISDTIRSLLLLEYAKENFEIIIVENGSTDKTFETAKSFEGGNVKVVQSQKGVSKAKNFGMSKINPQTNWIIFLDADTRLEKGFLNELDTYLDLHKAENLSIGTTTVRPEGRKRLYADFWFLFYNTGHALTSTSFAIQIVNAVYRDVIVFDEDRKFAEDLLLIKCLQKYGKFFYFRTKLVTTSTRRFDEVGWFRLFFKWNWQAIILSRTKRAAEEYGAIR